MLLLPTDPLRVPLRKRQSTYCWSGAPTRYRPAQAPLLASPAFTTAVTELSPSTPAPKSVTDMAGDVVCVARSDLSADVAVTTWVWKE